MPILQPIVDLAEICYAHGIRHVVISPGSRSAALTLAFVRHGGFTTHVYIDERSGAFVGLGIAQQINEPVALICTSGSAAYNFAPAVAEAFFQQIPLLVLTADRPPEWLHQYDGQTIFQSGLYGKHAKKSFDLPADYASEDAVWSINRMVNDACLTATAFPMGPVHVNVPIREPFYPAHGDFMTKSNPVRTVLKHDVLPQISITSWNELLDEFQASGRILIAGGQHAPDEELGLALGKIAGEWDIPVLVDCITNQEGNQEFIRHHDLFLDGSGEELSPDLLITFGQSFISKSLKQHFRRFKVKRHWHISTDTFLADPLQSITRQIETTARYFFTALFEKLDYQLFVENADLENDTNYLNSWKDKELTCRSLKDRYFTKDALLNDLTSLNLIFKYTYFKFQLHLANSMSVRYMNAVRPDQDFAGIFANRGTSGIDGCVSTAIGAAKVNQIPTILIVGDVAFLYDRNGLLSANLPTNLKIVVLNNGGGNIFRMIDGPASLPELGEYFETQHSFSAKRTCQDSDIAYFPATDVTSLENVINSFLKSETCSLLEVFTDAAENKAAWQALKQLYKSSRINDSF